jgi:DNA-binding IscR family transcriptional regulator
VQLLASEEYGLRCLLQLAERAEGVAGAGAPLGGAREALPPLPVQAIAEAEGLTPEYAAKLLRRLRLAGLVSSTRGAAGGYRLARPAAEIRVWDAVEALGGDLFPERFCACHAGTAASGGSGGTAVPDRGRRHTCVRAGGCAVRALWRSLAATVRRELERVTLRDLCRDEAGMTCWLRVAAPTDPRPLEVSPWPS